MSTFNLKISTPDGNVFDGEAFMVSVRGSEGDLAIMAGHARFVTAIKPCDVKITLPDESELSGRTEGGLLVVSNNIVTILSDSFCMH